jgi:hypothetical protein
MIGFCAMAGRARDEAITTVAMVAPCLILTHAS